MTTTTDSMPAIPATTADSRREIIEGVVRQLLAYYVFPEKAAAVAELLQARLAGGAYDGLDDPTAFAERLTADVQSVTADKHLRVRLSAPGAAMPVSDAASAEEEWAQYKQLSESRNHGVERVERLPLNLGYLDLRLFEMAALSGPAITAAMTLVAHTRALIVDLRHNRGGDPAAVALACSYLFDERTHLNSIYQRDGDRTDQYWSLDWVPGPRFGQRKPVFVLTSERTFSAAEEFAYNLQSHRRATVVGRRTRGGAHPGGPRPVSAHFEVFVPDGRSVSPITQGNWEGTGVLPDVDVPEEDALRVAQVLALKALAAMPDAPDVQALQARIAELEAARGA
jgi:C-terminal processing protease CtpA/Prc